MASKVSGTSLTCSICLERFRRPRILPCLHSYCEDCLRTYAPPGTTSMKCPICKDDIEVPDGDVTNFKLNVHLEGQVEDATNYEKLALDASPTLECNCCDEVQEAVGRCLDCEQFLCNFGIKSHQKISGLRGHGVYSLDEIRSGEVKITSQKNEQRMCERHSDEKARYFCYTCQDFICRECTVLDHPKPDHEFTYSTDAAKKYRKIVGEKLPALATIRDEFKDSQDLASKKAQDIENESTAAVQQLRAEVERFQIEIIEEEKRQLENITKMKHERNQEAQKYIFNFKNVHDRANHAYEMTKQLQETGSDEEFLSLYPLLNDRMDQLIEKEPEVIEMDGAYMMYSRPRRANVEIGKLELVKEIPSWGIYCESELCECHNDDAGFIAIDECHSGDLVAAFYDKNGGSISTFTTKGECKFEFKMELPEDENPILPLDINVMPDGQIAILTRDKVLIFDSSGIFVRQVPLDGFSEGTLHSTAEEESAKADLESDELSVETLNLVEGESVKAGSSSDYSGKLESAKADTDLSEKSSHSGEENDSSSETSNDDSIELGSIELVHHGNEKHFLVSFSRCCYILIYKVTSGELIRRVNLTFNPSRLAIVESDTFLVSGTHECVVVMLNTDGHVKLKIDVTTDGLKCPLGVCYDSSTAQIYVSLLMNCAPTVVQYTSNGFYVGCIISDLHSPLDIMCVGNKLAVANGENIKLFVKGNGQISDSESS